MTIINSKECKKDNMVDGFKEEKKKIGKEGEKRQTKRMKG